MNGDAIRIDVAYVDDVTAVTVAGDVDIDSAPALRRVLEAERLDCTVVVNLGDVAFMDSSGLSVLVTEHRRLTQGGGSLEIGSASPQVQRLVNVTGLDHLIRTDRMAL